MFYLDDRHDVGRGSFKFTHVDIEMVQLVPLGSPQDYIRAFADRMDAS